MANLGCEKRTLNEFEDSTSGKIESSNKRICCHLPSRLHDRTYEYTVGIDEFVSDHVGFKGILKDRYADFIVNEIDTERNLVRLTNLDSPKIPECDIDEDMLDSNTIEKIKELLEQKLEEVEIEVTDKDKQRRKDIHVALRQKFKDLESSTEDRGNKKFIIVKRTYKTKGRRFQPATGGNYLHFVLYKENKDTMETINAISHFLRVPTKVFSYAGSKDKRGKTSQWVSAYRLAPEKLLSINNRFKGIRVGNLAFKNNQLKLGDLLGNRFIVVLKQFDGNRDATETAMTSLKNKGFINYYGLQRFGVSSVATHQIGRALLKHRWKDAIDLILAPRAEDDDTMSKAKKTWHETCDAKQAIQEIKGRPSSIEGKLLSSLATSKTDLFAALHAIPRNLRLMYIHSYQSYVWNKVVTMRLRQHRLNVLEGDLVAKEKDVIVDDIKEESSEGEGGRKAMLQNMVKVLSDEDVERHNITDVLLPLPGHSVAFPQNEVRSFYDKVLEEDGMSWADFDSKHKEFSLSGAYRKLIVVPDDVNWEIVPYNDRTQPLALSDLDVLEGQNLPESSGENPLNALKLEFTLPPSSYATMAVREILHRSTFNDSEQQRKYSTCSH